MEIERNTYYTFEDFVGTVFSSYKYKKPSKKRLEETHTIIRLIDLMSFWEASHSGFDKLRDKYKFVRNLGAVARH